MQFQTKLLILASLFIHPLFAYSYEVDNFTDRETLKSDSLTKLDAAINKILTKATKGVHKEKGNDCNVAILRQEILRWIRPDPAGQLEIWLELTDKIDHTHIGLRKSIYQNVSFSEAPILNVVGIGRSMLLNGQIVGTDKVGHFFMQGLSYFDLVKGGKPLEKVLEEDHQEDGLWGIKTSGVKSYADMATNYQGYRFWSQLTQGSNPYFRCDEKSGWVNNRTFTWADYVTPAWDEAINCSEMKPKIQAKVDHYLAEHGWRCPLKPEACVKIIGLDHAEYFISPKCQVTAQKIMESEKLFPHSPENTRARAHNSY
jgi:hypothetical protein